MFYVQYRISFTNVAQPSATELINNLQTASVQEHTGKMRYSEYPINM